jgi:hypothetical protein
MNAPPIEEPPPSPPAPERCPECGAELAPGAVLCVSCGFDLKEGRKLETVREPEAEDVVPHSEPELGGAAEVRDPPRELPDLALPAPARKKELEKNLDLETRVFWLEERLRELERRVSGTSLTSRDFGVRMFAVFGLWLTAFLGIAFCLGALAALVYFLTLRL